jgi:Hemopexin
VWLATAFCTGGVVCVSVAGRSYALSAQLSRSYAIQQVARVRNELVRRARVDAAFARGDGALFLLSGDQYVRYSTLELDVVDDGYPRAIGESLLHELADEPPALPLGFQQDLDAALYDRNGALVLFKGKYFVRLEPNARGGELVPMEIKGTWGRVSNPFLPSQVDPQPHMDAAFLAPDHSLYVFKGGQYLRYTDPTAEFVDEGYPRAIRDQWGDLPDEFEAGIDGAFVFDGRTYLCRDKRYVRYGILAAAAWTPSIRSCSRTDGVRRMTSCWATCARFSATWRSTKAIRPRTPR